MSRMLAIGPNYPHAVPTCGYPSAVRQVMDFSTICPQSVDILWIKFPSGEEYPSVLGTSRDPVLPNRRPIRTRQHPSTDRPHLSTGTGYCDTPADQPQEWLSTASTAPMTMTTPLHRSDDEPHPPRRRWITTMPPGCTNGRVCCKTDASSHDTSWQGRTR